MKIDVSSRGERGRVRKGALALTLLAGVAVTPIALVLGSSPASAATTTTTYTPATPTLDSISSPSSCTTTGGPTCAPWNEYQGDTSASSYPSNPTNTNLTSPNLFPSYIPGGPTTTGGFPNVSVVPAASGNTPYPSGVVGTPGPLDDYCGPGSNAHGSRGGRSMYPSAGRMHPPAVAGLLPPCGQEHRQVA